MRRSARAQWYGAPPARGASPGRKSRARFPRTAINREEYGARERGEREGGEEARQRRAAPGKGVRMGVRHEPRPPAGPVGIEPLVEAEAHEPRQHELEPELGCREDVVAVV